MRRNRRRRSRRDGRLRRRRLLRATRPLAAIAAVGALLFGLDRALSIEDVRVRDADADLARAIERQLEQLKPLDFWHGRPAFLRERLLQAIPDLAEVRIRRLLPHTLIVRPVRRIPLALWQGEDGRVWLVDAQGTAYRRLRPDDDADLPLLRCDKEALPRGIAIVATLQAVDPRRAKTLSECIALAEGWRLNFDRRQRWLLPARDPSRRIARVVAVLREKRWRTGRWRVDARLSSRWFIRNAIHGGMI